MSKIRSDFIRDSLKTVTGAVEELDGSITVGPSFSEKPFAPHLPDPEDSPMEEEDIFEVTKRKGRPPAKDEPVENDEPVPLFPHLDKSSRHVIAFIRVHKKTPPGDGYKGDVAATTTLDLIGRRWGDGIYDFEGMNERHECLRRNQGIKIAFGGMGSDTFAPRPAPTVAPDPNLSERLLERQSVQHDRDAERAQKMSDRAMDVTRQLSTDYAALIREDSHTRIERDREYFRSQADQQSHFFQTLLVSLQTMHQQTMQIMQASHQQSMAANNPAFLLSLFERGLRFGQEAASDPDDPIGTVMKAGVSGLQEITKMMQLQGAMPTAKLQESNPVRSPNVPQKAGKKVALSRAELTELMRLKKLAARKGYDFEGLVKQAQTMVDQAPDASEDDEESEDAEEDDTEDAGPSPVA